MNFQEKPFGCNKIARVLLIVATLALFSLSAFPQATTGDISGVVVDNTNSLIPKAKVVATNNDTNQSFTATTNGNGEFKLQNLPVGSYTVTTTAPGFKATVLKDFPVELNKTATAHVQMQVGEVNVTVEVSSAAATIDTTTSQLGTTFDFKLQDYPTVAAGASGVLNLSLLQPGVASSGGIGAGTGPSVGGQRPRNNNFMVEGTDNNRKDITGPVVSLPNDSVAEFSVLQNQFAAEFGHSSGGQFSAVIRRGSNDLHGKLYDYLENRNLDALDQFWKRQGIFTKPRYDYNLLGAALGGPIKKNKIFYYGNFDYNPAGFASSANSNVYAPTAAGYATLATMSGVSQTNLNVLKQYAGAAPQQTSNFTSTVQGVAIPMGIVPILAPSY